MVIFSISRRARGLSYSVRLVRGIVKDYYLVIEQKVFGSIAMRGVDYHGK